MIRSVILYKISKNFNKVFISCHGNLKHRYSLFYTSNKSWLDQPKILSNSNEKISLIESLNFKKYRDKHNMILIEGHRQVIDALLSGLSPQIIVLTEEALSAPLGPKLRSLLDGLNPNKVRLVDDKVMKSLTNTVTSQGLVAAFTRPLSLTIDDAKSVMDDKVKSIVKPLIVITDDISDPGNMGTLIRTSYGFGVDLLISIGGCDIWSPKVLRSSMGSALKLPIVEWTWNDVQELISRSDSQILVTDVDNNSKPYYSIDYNLSSFIIIGSEAFGVSQSAKELQNVKFINIPMVRQLESLNAAVAGAAILSEASRQRSAQS